MKKSIYNILIIILSCFIFNSISAFAESDNPVNVVALSPTNKNLYIIIVEKNSQKLFLYSYCNDSYNLISTMDCSTGKVSGPKIREGDKKTPDGIYFFNNIYEQRELAPIYGVRAFPIDYPNYLDRLNNLDGNAIWLHGTNKDLKPMDSNGCIVLSDEDIEYISKYIELNKTPIIIIDKIDYNLSDAIIKKQGEKIDIFLSKWASAIRNGTYQQYLSYYNSSFVPDIVWWNFWIKSRNKNKKDKNFLITINNKIVYSYKDIFVAGFDMYIENTLLNEKVYIGTNKLFISFYNDEPKIIAEEFLSIPKMEDKLEVKHPILAAYYKFEKLIFKKEEEIKKEKEIKKDKDDIKNMIYAWLNAWSSKNLSEYIKYYSKNFLSDDFDILSWRTHKENLNNIYKYIKVDAEELRLKLNDSKCIAIFVQKYESDKYNAVGIKTLYLQREGEEWKIYRETWKEK